MVTKLAALVLLPAVLIGGVVANSSIIIVNVDEGPGGTSIMVPVPLALVQIALAFAPDEIKRIEVPEVAEYLPYLDRFVTALEPVPDALLVEVEDTGDHVRVSKEGDLIKVSVREDGDERVDVSIPLSMLRGILNAYDTQGGYFRTSRLVGALRAAPSGDLVHVVDGSDEVRVRMW